MHIWKTGIALNENELFWITSGLVSTERKCHQFGLTNTRGAAVDICGQLMTFFIR